MQLLGQKTFSSSDDQLPKRERWQAIDRSLLLPKTGHPFDRLF